MPRSYAIVMLVLAASGCIPQRNYVTADGPRYAGDPPPHVQAPQRSDTLRIVSFNIEFALQPESALVVLTTEPELRRADIVLLQEMDAPSTRYLARMLGMWFVYYPATLHLMHKRDFGNAILSRWPIVEDRKIMLPHHARLVGTARTATAATVRIGGRNLRVYSTHLGTYANITRAQREQQLRTILEDARPFQMVVLGGDMNDPGVGAMARAYGYTWPTAEGPRTAAIGRLDHIFLKGLSVPDSGAAGTVLNVRNASDHRPIWTRALLRQKQ